jgi:Cof subfamily protein (haloacid dehalogenase superfamily)
MIAVDLDGTLINSERSISHANQAAIVAAQAAGVLVVPSTGRSWRESRYVLRQFPRTKDQQVGVFATGAMVSELGEGQVLDTVMLDPDLAQRIVACLETLPEAVLIFQDYQRVGHEYMVSGRGPLSSNSHWWFKETEATVQYRRKPIVEDLHHTMRVGIVAGPEQAQQATSILAEKLGDQVSVQSFVAVQEPDMQQTVHVLEVFARGVEKWRGLEWIARRHGIEPGCIAVIGDGQNDLGAIRAAGCGIAMDNAEDHIKSAADQITCACRRDGVAHAIEQLLTGRW